MLKIKKILFQNFLFVYLLIILIFNLILLKFPLTNVFGYEYSLSNSILLSFLSGIFCIKLLKKQNQFPHSAKNKILNELFYSYLIFLIVPLFISLLNTLFTISCSISDGFLFYFVITFPSVVIGSSLGILCFVLFKKFKIILFILLFILVLSIPLFEFYFNPQVYFYNPIFAYLPGTIYDEGLEVNSTLVFYRILNLIYFCGVFTFFWKWIFNEIKFSKKNLFSIVVLFAAVFIIISPFLGFSTTVSSLKTELNGTIITPHFVIYYPKTIDEKLMKDIAVHHEYYYLELSKFFQVKFDNKITSFIFSSNEQKKKLFGSGNADVAKPWLYETFTVYDNYLSTLKHEIAHCFTAAFAKGLFKVADNFNPSLIEGAAVAADPIYDENKISFMAALAYQNGYKFKINNLYNFLSFFENTSSISYVYAGAFSEFLIRTYGINKFKKLYNNLDFKEIYNVPLDTLSYQFYSYLDSINAKNKPDEANYYFGRVSIFYKVCPRYISSRLIKAWNYYNHKEYEKSKKLFSKLLKVTNNYSAVIGLAKSYSKLNDYDQSVQLLQKNLIDFKNTSYYYGTELILGDILSEQGKFSEAKKYYQKLVKQNPGRTYFYIANLRESLLKKDSLITIYLKGNEIDKFLILKDINKEKYNYFSIPVLIDLSKALNEEYKIFIKQFDKTIYIENYQSSYAMYQLSNYMLEHLDFSNSRKTAALSLRYNADNNFDYILKNNFKKTDWFYYNANSLLSKITIN